MESPDTGVRFVFGLKHKASASPKAPACARLSQTPPFPGPARDKTRAPAYKPGGPHGSFVCQE